MGTSAVDRPDDSAAQEQAAADGRLLEQFLQEGNQDAFAALMQRHGPYILAVCQRMTYHAQDAEDVFQACFLELVRNAASITRRSSVAGWLQTVAVRLARKARTRRARRQQRESSVPMKEATATADEITWREVRQVLEEEVARLPEDLRAPVILCLFQGLTQDEAAQRLEIPPRTLKDRVRRGREILRGRLVRRGVTLAVLGALLSAGTTHATVPPALAQATVQGVTALASKASLAGIVSPSVLSLTGTSSLLAGRLLLAAVLLGLLMGGAALYLTRDQPIAPAPLEVSAKPRILQRSFRGMQFDDQLFQWTGPSYERFVKQEEEGIRITLPAQGGPNDAVGISLRYPVRGDFTVDGLLQILHAEQPVAGGGAGANLYVYLESPARDGLWLGKMWYPRRSPTFTVGQRAIVGNERKNKDIHTWLTQPATGFARLRAVRHGKQFTFYAAEGDAGELQLLEEREVHGADVRILRFGADNGWFPDVAVDVRLVEFSLQADEIVGYDWPAR